VPDTFLASAAGANVISTVFDSPRFRSPMSQNNSFAGAMPCGGISFSPSGFGSHLVRAAAPSGHGIRTLTRSAFAWDEFVTVTLYGTGLPTGTCDGVRSCSCSTGGGGSNTAACPRPGVTLTPVGVVVPVGVRGVSGTVAGGTGGSSRWMGMTFGS
jgi:hypothetical protein